MAAAEDAEGDTRDAALTGSFLGGTLVAFSAREQGAYLVGGVELGALGSLLDRRRVR